MRIFANIFGLLLALLLISGCATSSKMLVSPNGKAVRCHSAGMGAVGAATSAMAFSKCVDDYTALGYVDIDEAGLTGFRKIGTRKQKLTVLMVHPNSPASKAGVVAGDEILEVDNTRVLDPTDALSRLFGKIGTQVEVKI